MLIVGGWEVPTGLSLSRCPQALDELVTMAGPILSAAVAPQAAASLALISTIDHHHLPDF